jgi:hypothetical protein
MSYHPNARPYKVICVLPNKEPFIKKQFSNKDKAVKYATKLSLKYKKWTIRVEKMLNKNLGPL